MVTRSDYKYEVIPDDKIIVIEDLDNKKVSLTNDIENVITEISDKEGLAVNDFKIVYKDSEGYWDGFNQISGKFIFLRITRRKQAMDFAKKTNIKQWLR